ncbi:MAG TPA: efflux RND transporter periplasmic adaptor subunit [Dehalococcoidales bacterium]|nr:efflux RND transporter periplasmic adaptor subunit [Dehalococcoidales bacterium]
MKSWRIVTILLCLALAASTACSPFGGEGDGEVTEQSVEVVRGDLVVTISGSGNIAVSDEVRLVFGVGGKIDKIYVDEGDKVTEGDVLAKLDTDTLELALTQAKAAQTQAEAALAQAEAAQVQASAVRDDAEYSLKQLKKVLLASSDRVKVAEAYLDAAELQFKAAESQFKAAESQLEMAGQVVAEAQRQLDEATITAPFNGLVASVYAKAGDIVPSPTMSPMAIIHLIDPATMELEAEVDEIDIADVEPGQRAIIEVDALPDVQFEGVVVSISPLPSLRGGVVLYDVKIGFSVPEGSALRVGMSATADIIISERSNVLLVPSRAIIKDSQGRAIVQVVVDKQTEERLVVVGLSDGFDTEIIDGLKEGEVVLRKPS